MVNNVLHMCTHTQIDLNARPGHVYKCCSAKNRAFRCPSSTTPNNHDVIALRNFNSRMFSL
jgi:hypothetical protein